MKLKRKFLFIISFVPLVLSAVAVFFMEDMVPMHYNLNSEVDRYGSKYEIFIMPLIIIAFYLFWVIYIKFYKASSTDDNAKVDNNVNVLYIVALSVMGMLCVIDLLFLGMAIVNAPKTIGTFDLFSILNLILGVFFIVIGNFLPKTKRNGVLGVRTSWTKNSDKAWYVANRNAGIAFVLSGVASFVLAFAVGGTLSVAIMLGFMFISLIASYIYSYISVSKAKRD